MTLAKLFGALVGVVLAIGWAIGAWMSAFGHAPERPNYSVMPGLRLVVELRRTRREQWQKEVARATLEDVLRR